MSPLTAMESARYIYACSTSNESFGAALGKASKIDVLVRFDATGCQPIAQRSADCAAERDEEIGKRHDVLLYASYDGYPSLSIELQMQVNP